MCRLGLACELPGLSLLAQQTLSLLQEQDPQE
ncbi:hypothetical protein FGF01_01745 [Aeromonas salmonicida subsp. achromogenes]|nr:hypothetical protein C5P03_20335 [Aeromonas salmonicida subsp. salmonicida 01-B526]MUG27321.1 hypothetical protein [Aeromonas salmonicida]QEO82285.1 hypothetical protein E3D14_01720 [Aeromonas salmonicida subsp. salmonicida]TMX14082.1 hypothetical protein FGF01_01745 [Aeromonas salmonicida subsp. achromogenes]QHE44655.1 hypothetical protein GO992_16335 [Aeromonas salmonicida subsp. salmonicida]